MFSFIKQREFGNKVQRNAYYCYKCKKITRKPCVKCAQCSKIIWCKSCPRYNTDNDWICTECNDIRFKEYMEIRRIQF